MEKTPSKQSSRPDVAESPIVDVFENRHPSAAEKKWAEQTLAPTLGKAPERPIGILQSGAGPDVRLWMRTAVRKEITSFGTFLSCAYRKLRPRMDWPL